MVGFKIEDRLAGHESLRNLTKVKCGRRTAENSNEPMSAMGRLRPIFVPVLAYRQYTACFLGREGPMIGVVCTAYGCSVSSITISENTRSWRIAVRLCLVFLMSERHL